MTPSTECQHKDPEQTFSHLRTATSSYRLNQIEKIRANGIGDVVELPQLVVCGDQSAGKSSVLEGITGIPFPRQDGLCTRFPTEIILRHAESESTTITASIRPHASRAQEAKKSLALYQKNVRHMSELTQIIETVSKLMGIRGYTDSQDSCAFASDALRIEITGPIGLHLSVVDLPGLISVSNEEQTEADVEAVHDMVSTYLQSSRTIILAVLQASNDMANQPIIKLARTHDPEGQRTVGIITKPDIINVGSEYKVALDAKNQGSIKLKLGFFLVKNPSLQEIGEGFTMDTRSHRELRFFSAPVWKRQMLDMDRVGAEKLRLYLQRLLDSHIERELPKVREEIKKHLAETNKELRSMGDGRPTVGHIRSFVTSLSMRFYELCQAALEGNYHSIDHDFFSNVESRLRARIQEDNTKLADHMRDYGQRRKVGTESDSTKPNDDESTDKTTQIIVTKAQEIEWVKEAYIRTRGKELPGNHNSALLYELYREQSRLWPRIAEDHVHDILRVVSKWTDHAVQRLVHEDRLRSEIGSILREWLDSAEKIALEELEKLIEDERRGPATYNHYYPDNVQRSRLDTQKAKLRKAVSLAVSGWDGRTINFFPDEIENFITAAESQIIVNMDEQACNDAITELKAYYKVALKTFIDNVARQVIERHIVSPLAQAFCPNSVSQLSDEALLRIGSEPEQQTERRQKLSILAQGLQKSLLDLQRPLS